ncbi:hypothetical protein [Halopseudomonas salegens]|uniref:Lipoprotein n=1 Tax=Halopseudomonas salegens TaxID=1434072 RepID=A0A1H2HEX2_9GAMM|nr:hypothetical protein [Halopseudomonas salegens]SDU30461.1 hypothetical protein SAMN05216210_2997 [Halopseudomonas salegens]
MKKVIYGALLASTVLLSACSSGPSESDIKALLEAEMEKMSAMIGELGGDSMSDMLEVEIHKVTIHSCEEERSDVYRCDVEVDATAPVTGRSVERAEIVLAKSDDGWIQAQ